MDELALDRLLIEEPATEEPIAEETTVAEPTTTQPTIRHPTTGKPMVIQPKTGFRLMPTSCGGWSVLGPGCYLIALLPGELLDRIFLEYIEFFYHDDPEFKFLRVAHGRMYDLMRVCRLFYQRIVPWLYRDISVANEYAYTLWNTLGPDTPRAASLRKLIRTFRFHRDCHPWDDARRLTMMKGLPSLTTIDVSFLPKAGHLTPWLKDMAKSLKHSSAIERVRVKAINKLPRYTLPIYERRGKVCGGWSDMEPGALDGFPNIRELDIQGKTCCIFIPAVDDGLALPKKMLLTKLSLGYYQGSALNLKQVFGSLPHLKSLSLVIGHSFLGCDLHRVGGIHNYRLTACEVIDALQPLARTLREIKMNFGDVSQLSYEIGSTALDLSNFSDLETLELEPNYLDFERGFPPNLRTWTSWLYSPGPAWSWRAHIIRSALSVGSKESDDTLFQPQPIRMPWKLEYGCYTWFEETRDTHIFGGRIRRIVTEFKQRAVAPQKPYNGLLRRGPWIDPALF